MTDKLTDEEIAALEGLAKPFGKGQITDEVRKSLLAKGMVKSKGVGVLGITVKGVIAVKKK